MSSRPRSCEDAAAQPGGEEREPAQRRARELLERRVLVRIAAEAALQPRRVEHERGADHGHAGGERALEREAELPAARPRPSRAASRRSTRAASPAPHAPSSAPGPPWSTVSAAVTQTTRSVSASEAVDPQRRPSGVGEVDEVGRLGVVHLDVAVEAPREGGRDERLELALARAPVEAAGDEDRLLPRRHAEPLELLDRRRERRPARVVLRARQRQLRRLDDDRRLPAAPSRAPRAARRRAGSGARRGRPRRRRDRLGRRRRPQHERVLGRVDDRDARARQERDPRHYGMCR